MGRATQARVARLVGVRRAVQNNGNVKREPKYRRISSTCFLLLNFFLFSWLLRWTDLLILFFVRVASRRLRSAIDNIAPYPGLETFQLCHPLRITQEVVLPVAYIMKRRSGIHETTESLSRWDVQTQWFTCTGGSTLQLQKMEHN